MKFIIDIFDLSFLSPYDETAFFHWIRTIQEVEAIEGVGRELRITMSKPELSDQSLRNFIALHERYDLDMSNLKIFKTPENQEWFSQNKDAYWYDKVFG